MSDDTTAVVVPEVAAPAASTAPVVAPAAPTHTPVAAVAPVSDWRSEYAKGDEKILNRLSRYPSQQAVVDALINAQNKIAAGGAKSALSENPTPEELAEYRADNGIPEEATGYDIKMPEGVEFDEAAKKSIDGFVDMAHKMNMRPDQVSAAVEHIISQQAAEAEAMEQQDDAYRVASQERLQAEMGSELPLNINMINAMLDDAPAGVKDQLLQARLADGTLLGNNPEAIRWLAGLARELRPTPSVAPSGNGGGGLSREAEMAGIQALMGDHSSKYWKGPEAAAMQARFLKLASGKK